MHSQVLPTTKEFPLRSMYSSQRTSLGQPAKFTALKLTSGYYLVQKLYPYRCRSKFKPSRQLNGLQVYRAGKMRYT